MPPPSAARSKLLLNKRRFFPLRYAVYMFLLRALMAVGILAPPGALAADYVGSNVCKTCHPDVWATFYRNPHFKSLASGKESPENTGCESCHGPGKAHVEARGGKATIVAFSELGPEKTLDACLRCHGQTLVAREHPPQRRTPRRTLSAPTAIRSTNRRCPNFCSPSSRPSCATAATPTVRAQFSMPFKHRVNEGIGAVHGLPQSARRFDPTWRMASRPHMVDQQEGNEEACLNCHIDKRGPFVFEHGSVEVEGCETCHQPHGSTNARLLKRPTVFTLCLECHNGQGNFGSFGPAFSTACRIRRRTTIWPIRGFRTAPRATSRFTGRTPASSSSGRSRRTMKTLISIPLWPRCSLRARASRRLRPHQRAGRQSARRQHRRLQHHAVLRARLSLRDHRRRFRHVPQHGQLHRRHPAAFELAFDPIARRATATASTRSSSTPRGWATIRISSRPLRIEKNASIATT